MGAIAEILPPEGGPNHKPNGKFAEGNNANPSGRPAGALSFNTRKIRAAIMEALDQVSGGDGGVNYFMILAATKPEIFVPLVAKCLPIQLAGDDQDEKLEVTAVRHVYVDGPGK